MTVKSKKIFSIRENARSDFFNLCEQIGKNEKSSTNSAGKKQEMFSLFFGEEHDMIVKVPFPKKFLLSRVSHVSISGYC